MLAFAVVVSGSTSSCVAIILHYCELLIYYISCHYISCHNFVLCCCSYGDRKDIGFVKTPLLQSPNHNPNTRFSRECYVAWKNYIDVGRLHEKTKSNT